MVPRLDQKVRLTAVLTAFLAGCLTGFPATTGLGQQAPPEPVPQAGDWSDHNREEERPAAVEKAPGPVEPKPMMNKMPYILHQQPPEPLPGDDDWDQPRPQG